MRACDGNRRSKRGARPALEVPLAHLTYYPDVRMPAAGTCREMCPGRLLPLCVRSALGVSDNLWTPVLAHAAGCCNHGDLLKLLIGAADSCYDDIGWDAKPTRGELDP